MASIIDKDQQARSSIQNDLTSYIASQTHPIYVRSVVERFGRTIEEQDSIRSLVWELISQHHLLLENDLTLSVAKNEC